MALDPPKQSLSRSSFDALCERNSPFAPFYAEIKDIWIHNEDKLG